MPAANFPIAYKNLLLDCITGRGSTIVSGNQLAGSVTMTIYASAYGDTATSLGTVTLNGATWGSPIAGTAAFSAVFTPSGTGTAVWARIALTVGNIDGLVTTTGNGGMIIVPSTSFVTGTGVALTATVRCPFNNGLTLRINQAFANAIVRLMVSGTLGSGGLARASGSTLEIYSGTQPATADTPITSQTLLGTYTSNMSTARWNAAVGAVAQFGSQLLQSSNAVATATATWFRWSTSSDGFVLDGAASGTGGGGDMILSSTTFTSGQALPACNALTLTLP